MTRINTPLPAFTFLHPIGSDYTIEAGGNSYSLLSAVQEVKEGFSFLILSAQYQPGPDSDLITQVQVRQGDTWSPFFKLAFYSQKLNHSFDLQTCPAGEVQVDQLQLTRPANAYRFLLTGQGPARAESVAVCVASSAGIERDAFALPKGQRQIALRPISQMQLPVEPDMQKRLCSPTSLCMALHALGVACDPLETAAAVYDKQAAIYGNWTFNTAYAGARGLFACVTRFDTLTELAEYINEDSLVLASIAYQKGALSGAAVEQTLGHLVLICGWQNGKICVADPAAQTMQEVLRFYDAAEFARAWLVNKHGIAYLVRKK